MMHRKARLVGFRWILIAALCFASIGCDNNPHGTVKVFGRVTVGGEEPGIPGTVSFTVVQPASGFPSRPAMAKFGADGNYTVTSFEPNDGLVPGEYNAGVECYETPPNMEGKPVKSHIDRKYMNGETSGLELTVEPGAKPIEFDIEVD